MHYKIQVGPNIWKRHLDQVTDIGSKVPLANDTNFYERYTENYTCENTDIEQDDPHLIRCNITKPQPTDSRFIHPNTLNRKSTNLIPTVPKSTVPNSKNDFSPTVF